MVQVIECDATGVRNGYTGPSLTQIALDRQPCSGVR
jgi:hypothetical protein